MCFFVPIGVCPVVPDIHFKDSYTFLDPSFTESKENNFNRTAISIHDLVGLCSQAPFGRNEKTVVDKTVRSCWQIDPEKFTIANTITWNKAFNDLKSAASSVFAPELNSNQVQLRLYKLLVYEKGSFFLPHRDTQKDENHFGTVVLSIPVKHKTGGDNSNKRCFGTKLKLFRESGDFAGNRYTWEFFWETRDNSGTLPKKIGTSNVHHHLTIMA